WLRQSVGGWTVAVAVQVKGGDSRNVIRRSANIGDDGSDDGTNAAVGVGAALNGIAACPQNGAGPANSDGTLRQNELDGPGKRAVAASLFRDFNITERVKFQLRGESTNVFNLTNLPNPTLPLSSGAPTATGGFGKINGAINAGTFGNRVLQVGARVLF